MGRFERYLSLWIGLAIVAGVILGTLFPAGFQALATLEIAQVNLVVAALIWAMIYPMMVQVDLRAAAQVRRQPQGLLLTLVVNWLIKPFTMAALGVLFFRGLFASFVTAEEGSEIIAGMILLGVAPCTAMVFVWSQLTKGDPNYTLVQVSLNDLIMVLVFAPLTAFLLGVSEIVVPWSTLLLAVALYVVLPLGAGAWTRRRFEGRGALEALDAFTARLKPFGMAGLVLTVVLLFGFQAQTILAKPLLIGLIAIPLLLQTYGIFALAYGVARRLGLPHRIA
ncbi:MAG: ACR3 family arsenite efflux transporter, partial [Pseudomonadales bacterium]